jgi:hypothetical protein
VRKFFIFVLYILLEFSFHYHFVKIYLRTIVWPLAWNFFKNLTDWDDFFSVCSTSWCSITCSGSTHRLFWLLGLSGLLGLLGLSGLLWVLMVITLIKIVSFIRVASVITAYRFVKTAVSKFNLIFVYHHVQFLSQLTIRVGVVIIMVVVIHDRCSSWALLFSVVII